jgi:hypothetical protein
VRVTASLNLNVDLILKGAFAAAAHVALITQVTNVFCL